MWELPSTLTSRYRLIFCISHYWTEAQCGAAQQLSIQLTVSQAEVYGQLWDNYWGGFLQHLDVKVHRRQIN